MSLSWDISEHQVRVTWGERLDRDSIAPVTDVLAKAPKTLEWQVDLANVEAMDALGMVALLRLGKEVIAAGGSFHLAEVSDEAEAGLRLYRFRELLEQPPPEPERRVAGFELVGQMWYTFVEAAWGFAILLYDAIYWTVVAPLRGKGFKAGILVKEVSRNGLDAVPIVALVAFLFGVVLSINGAYLLGRWGQNALIADMIGIGLTREIAPILAGIMLAARSGAAIAAEIGTMQVREEIDAMWTMGMNPAKFITVPKVGSLAISVPVLSLVANIAGIFGAFLVCTTVFGVAGPTFLRRLAKAVLFKDVMTGFGKSLVFGLIIGFIGCWFGYSVRDTAEEVGQAATGAVVWGIIMIIVADGIFSAMVYMMG